LVEFESGHAHHAAPRGRIVMTNLKRLLGSCWLLWLGLAVVVFAGTASAEFTNGFSEVKAGESLELSWEKVEERHLPVCITAQLIHKGKDGSSATVYKANVTSRFLSLLFGGCLR
jgi:hypothetical protein